MTWSLTATICLLMNSFCSLIRSATVLKRLARPSASDSTSCRAGMLAGSSAAVCREEKNFCTEGVMPVVVPASSESSCSIWLL
ncbi:hypothetical protein D3C80_2036240 [compost metagenome]